MKIDDKPYYKIMLINELLRSYMPKRNIPSYTFDNVESLQNSLIVKLNEMHQ